MKKRTIIKNQSDEIMELREANAALVIENDVLKEAICEVRGALQGLDEWVAEYDEDEDEEDDDDNNCYDTWTIKNKEYI